MGIVVTAKIDPDKTDGRQIVAIPTTPREVPNYPGRSFPGYTFEVSIYGIKMTVQIGQKSDRNDRVGGLY